MSIEEASRHPDSGGWSCEGRAFERRSKCPRLVHDWVRDSVPLSAEEEEDIDDAELRNQTVSNLNITNF